MNTAWLATHVTSKMSTALTLRSCRRVTYISCQLARQVSTMLHLFHTIRKYILIVWFLCMAIILCIFLFKPDIFHTLLAHALHISPVWAYALFLILGCLRGFTLIPSTNLIILGFLFFPVTPLFILIVTGILISSASVYYFSEFLQLHEFFERKYPKRVAEVKSILEKHELPVIMVWSFLPFAPTDLICYVCGALKINFKKFLFGIFVGESIMCGIYIFGGHYLLRFLHIL